MKRIRKFLGSVAPGNQTTSGDSETHAEGDAVVRSSWDGSSVKAPNDLPTTAKELLERIKGAPVRRHDDASFAHPTHPVRTLLTAEVDGLSVVASGYSDPLWFKRDGYVDAAVVVSSSGRRVKLPGREALEVLWALHHAHQGAAK